MGCCNVRPLAITDDPTDAPVAGLELRPGVPSVESCAGGILSPAFSPTGVGPRAGSGGNDGLIWPQCDGLIWPHLPSERDWTVRVFEHGSEVAEGMGSRVELFERIRRDREFENLSLRALARRHGVHRRAVRQALELPVPPQRKRPEGRRAPALGPYHELIDEWLLADRDAPRKQRHTAKRIHDRLVAEHAAVVAETTVRDYVRRRRRELGSAAEAFCPQVHDPGVTARG